MKYSIFKIKKVSQFAIAAAIATASGASSAGPIVTQWSYSSNPEFTGSGFQSAGSGTTTTNPYELSWGAAGGSFDMPTGNFNQDRSGLTIGNGPDGTIQGGGPATGIVDTVIGGGIPSGSQVGLGTNISHWNNPISGAFNTLLSGQVTETLTLSPNIPDSPDIIITPTLLFDFLFKETPNNAACAGGTAPPCGDLFGFAEFPTLDQAFDYDGNTYLASLLVIGLNDEVSPIASLLDDECAVLGLSDGCLGWRTDEDQTTTVQFALSISTKPVYVPEPTSIALIGMGLLGFVFGRIKSQVI